MSEDTIDQIAVAAQESELEPSPDTAAALPCNEVEPVLLDEDLLRLYVGPNADNFVKIYRAQVEKRSIFSFNWPVFFLPLPWLFYRKLYLVGACVLLIPIVMIVIFPGLSDVSLTGVAAVLAVSGNAIYVGSATRRIQKLKALDLSSEELRDRVRAAGGTSSGGAAFGALIFVSSVALVFVGMASTELPECTSPKVQDLAKSVILDGLSKQGMESGKLELQDFSTVASGTNSLRNMCRFTIKSETVTSTRYLSITWQDQNSGKYLLRVGSTPSALKD